MENFSFLTIIWDFFKNIVVVFYITSFVILSPTYPKIQGDPALWDPPVDTLVSETDLSLRLF